MRLGLFDVYGGDVDEAFDRTIAPLPPELARTGFVLSLRAILYARHPHFMPASVGVRFYTGCHLIVVHVWFT